MNLFFLPSFQRTVVLSVALWSLTSIGHAGPALTVSAKAKPPASTNPSTNIVAIPQSVFVWPPTVKDGRDPFFPESIRIYDQGKVNTNSPVSTVILKLNGISGSGTNRLVMINGHTFAQGESGEILTSSGRIKVRCVEIINDESALIEVNGVPRELRMKEH